MNKPQGGLVLSLSFLDACENYFRAFIKMSELSADEPPVVRGVKPLADWRQEKRREEGQPAEVRFDVDSNQLPCEVGPRRMRDEP